MQDSQQPRARLDSVDFLKGLALTVVLLDHIDFLAGGSRFIRHWTLKGFGFCDAADAFIFLFGFTFGWVYGPKVLSGLILPVQKRVLLRTLHIYGGYLVTLAIVLLIGNWTAPQSRSANDATQVTLWAVLSLTYQPFGLGILCFYMVVLPVLPALLALFSRHKWLTVGLSCALYGLVQTYPNLNLTVHNGSGWFFNPLAWQFLIVIGLIIGYRSRAEGIPVPRSGLLTICCIVVAVCIFLIKRGEMFLNEQQIQLMQLRADLLKSSSPWISKTNLGPLRLLHGLAVFYLVYQIIPFVRSEWLHTLAKPLMICGRNSLAVYCVGIVLTHLSTIVFYYFGNSRFAIASLAIDACLLQFGIAYWLNHRRQPKRFLQDQTGAITKPMQSTS